MRYFWTFFGVILSIVCIKYFWTYLPQDTFYNIKAHWLLLVKTFFILSIAYYIRAIKAYFLLKDSTPFRKGFASGLYCSIAMNNILPFRLGDVFRLFYYCNVLETKLATVTAALIIERITDLFSILLLFLLFAWVIDFNLLMELINNCLFWSINHISVLLFTLPIILFAIYLGIKFSYAKIISPTLAQLNLGRKRILFFFILSLMQWVIEIIILSIFLILTLKSVPQGAGILSAFLCNLATLIPSAPGFVGTFEVAGLLPFKILSENILEQGSFFVLIYHLSIWVFSTVLGIGALPLVFKNKQKQQLFAKQKVFITESFLS